MNKRWFTAMLVLTFAMSASNLFAGRESKVSLTKHNLSSSGPGTTKSTTEDQICVFCHTPHGADTSKGPAPLWNKTLSGATYTVYDSASLDAAIVQGVGDTRQPLGSSKLCLSCHDGVMALGSVRVLRGVQNVTIQGGAQVTMPVGSGVTTGFTRNLGGADNKDLTNDHPISVTYTDTLATRDGELRSPTNSTGLQGQTLNRWGTVFGARQPLDGYKPLLPLEPLGAGSAGQVQCTTCHDPHIRETNSGTTGTGEGNIKFLRANRFQRDQPTSSYSATNDIICLACHDKGAGGNSWAYSAHANKQVATQTYSSAAATTREFPKIGDSGITEDLAVWKAACLNCHDTHTVSGARRLAREGASGGKSAIEETCYQCHSSTGIITPLATVPNIKTDFTAAGNKRMPIANTIEVHDIGGNFNDATFNDCTGTANKCGADFIESRANLGLTDLTKRHAECTDCHNPHRVIKYKNGLPGDLTALTFNNTGMSASGTHKHTDDGTDIHSNLISGVLRGSWGVEPTYSSPSFQVRPSGFTVKRGDPAASALTDVNQGYVTREYQICMKCHSNYSYSDDDIYPNSATRPSLGGAGLTAANANGHTNFTTYTNQAKEFQAPTSHAVAVGSVSLGNNGGTGTAGSNANNHRSWHPVMAPTGRTGRAGTWLAPWNESGAGSKAGRLGAQTMYCSDCHGSATANGTAIPSGGENGSPWGPHGSSINFLLKGDYSTATGVEQTSGLCFKCHSYGAYATGGGGTGWRISKDDNSNLGDGHQYHRDKIRPPGSSTNGLRCNWCHVAVPHGWKNRNFLVNLLDVGAEAGSPANPAVTYTKNVGYTNGPYYRNSFLRVVSFPAAGVRWKAVNCNGGNTDNSGMRATCDNPN